MKNNRRNFIKTAAVGGIGLAMAPNIAFGKKQKEKETQWWWRTKTGSQSSFNSSRSPNVEEVAQETLKMMYINFISCCSKNFGP